MKTVGSTEFITAREFSGWLAAAKPGDVLLYATGALGTDTDLGFINKDAGAPEAHALAGAAYAAWKHGDVYLLQHRVGAVPTNGQPGKFQYLAIRRSQTREQQ